MSTRLLPLGRQLDLLPPDGDLPGVGHVQLGHEVHALSSPAMLVWASCRSTPTSPGDRPWGHAEADALAARWGLADTARARAWDEATGLGLLVELPDDPDAHRAWAQAHTLHPLLAGLGATDSSPGRFGIGLPDEPFLALPLPLYELWAWGSLHPDLWTAARWHAEAARAAGSDDPDATDAGRLLAGLVGTLHPLLSVDAVCLDLAVTP